MNTEKNGLPPRVQVLMVNEERRLAGYPGYEVRIFRDGQFVDVQAVYAENEEKAKTAAMAMTEAEFRGEFVTFEIRPLNKPS